jgi:hypothetical protein
MVQAVANGSSPGVPARIALGALPARWRRKVTSRNMAETDLMTNALVVMNAAMIAIPEFSSTL